MDQIDSLYSTRFGPPVVKDGCGVFGILRKKDAPRIASSVAVSGISCIKYRGSNLGSGYASLKLAEGSLPGAPYRVKAFVRGEEVAIAIRNELSSQIGAIENEYFPKPVGGDFKLGVWQASLFPATGSERNLELALDRINLSLLSSGSIKGRIFSCGKYVDVYKEVGYPIDVARMWGLDSRSEDSDLWIAHTRQPTNSPGSFPIWSHPFASMDCAIVHNGDISSFGANMELLNSWGFRSHVGTDSEVIARLLDHLVRIDGLSVSEAATVLTNPFERDLSSQTLRLMAKYRGARLDGPFAVVAGYCDGTDAYLVALTDRSKFRPLLIGEDEYNFYVASEENQIRNHSREAKIWTPEPGSFFIASLQNGIVVPGTRRDRSLQHSVLMKSIEKFDTSEEFDVQPSIDSWGMEFREINAAIFKAREQGRQGITITNVSGQRYLGIGISTRRGDRHIPFKITLTGYPGNCLANLNDGASFEVYGNVADDIADTMHAGSIVVHGNARDVVGQALQGGHIFVRGSVGNRAAIQMREYQHERPFIIVGETADNYLGEYMAGGVALVLNLSGSTRPVLDYVGTGMVGGSIYIRGRVSDSQVGLIPQRSDVLNYLRASMVDGVISRETFDKIANAGSVSREQLADILPESLFARVRFLFFSSKYTKPLVVARKTLAHSDLAILSEKVGEFFSAFRLSGELLEEVLRSEFTIIRTQEEKMETPVPPQEVPVEE